MDPRQSVRPGDPIRLAAEQVNGLNRLLSPRGGYGGPGGEDYSRPYSWVYYKGNVNRGHAVQLTNLLNTPQLIEGINMPNIYSGVRAKEFDVPIFTAGNPRNYDSTKIRGAWGVAVETIATRVLGESPATLRIGRVAVAGTTMAIINVIDESHRFVRFDGSFLLTAAAGQALILWQEPGLGYPKWAVIRMGYEPTTLGIEFTAPWTKNTIRNVRNASAVNQNNQAAWQINDVINLYGNIGGTGTRKGAIAWMNDGQFDRWVLIAAEC